MIAPSEDENDNYTTTQIINGDEEQISWLMPDEKSEQLSLSIRQTILQSKLNSYNSMKNQYNETFILAC